MKERKLTSVLAVCAAIAMIAGCNGGNTAATTTTAAETTTTTTTAAETTTTTTPPQTTAEEENPMEMTAPMFQKGVWKAMDGEKEDSYFAFYDETKGVVIDIEEGRPTEFTCEQNGTDIVFHLGENDYQVKAEFKLGDAQGTFHYDDTDKVLFFAYLDGTDPEEFVKNYGSENSDSSVLFHRGVWSASVDGEVKVYFLFYDETSGATRDPELGIGLPFACEQNGTEIMFHFASADDNTPATFDLSNNTGTFTYGDTQITYQFEGMNVDPDEFNASLDSSAGDDMTVTHIFTKGVWSASVDGEIKTYFVFNDETSGSTVDPELGIGVPFACEQNGTDIMFHFASADNNTPAKFDLGDATGTFDYGEKQITYSFNHLEGTELDEFNEKFAQ